MKTDETNFVRNREAPSREAGPQRVAPVPATGAENAESREADAFDLWRARWNRGGRGEGGAEDGPTDAYRDAAHIAPKTGDDQPREGYSGLADIASIHGLDPESLEDKVAGALDALTHEVADLTAALKAAAERIDRLEHRIEHDSLTGLMDRAGLLHEIAHAQSLDRREGGRSTLALVDLGEAPTVRRRHGRPAMEALIEQVARTLEEATAAGEPLAHLGEGEFAVILPGRPPDDAAERLGAILEAALAKPFRHAGESHALSATVGLAAVGPAPGGAEADADPPDPTAVLAAADTDLRRS